MNESNRVIIPPPPIVGCHRALQGGDEARCEHRGDAGSRLFFKILGLFPYFPSFPISYYYLSRHAHPISAMAAPAPGSWSAKPSDRAEESTPPPPPLPPLPPLPRSPSYIYIYIYSTWQMLSCTASSHTASAVLSAGSGGWKVAEVIQER